MSDEAIPEGKIQKKKTGEMRIRRNGQWQHYGTIQQELRPAKFWESGVKAVTELPEDLRGLNQVLNESMANPKIQGLPNTLKAPIAVADALIGDPSKSGVAERLPQTFYNAVKFGTQLGTGLPTLGTAAAPAGELMDKYIGAPLGLAQEKADVERVVDARDGLMKALVPGLGGKGIRGAGGAAKGGATELRKRLVGIRKKDLAEGIRAGRLKTDDFGQLSNKKLSSLKIIEDDGFFEMGLNSPETAAAKMGAKISQLTDDLDNYTEQVAKKVPSKTKFKVDFSDVESHIARKVSADAVENVTKVFDQIKDDWASSSQGFRDLLTHKRKLSKSKDFRSTTASIENDVSAVKRKMYGAFQDAIEKNYEGIIKHTGDAKLAGKLKETNSKLSAYLDLKDSVVDAASKGEPSGMRGVLAGLSPLSKENTGLAAALATGAYQGAISGPAAVGIGAGIAGSRSLARAFPGASSKLLRGGSMIAEPVGLMGEAMGKSSPVVDSLLDRRYQR